MSVQTPRPSGPRIPQPLDNTAWYRPEMDGKPAISIAAIEVPCGYCGKPVPKGKGVQCWVPTTDLMRRHHLAIVHPYCWHGE